MGDPYEHKRPRRQQKNTFINTIAITQTYPRRPRRLHLFNRPTAIILLGTRAYADRGSSVLCGADCARAASHARIDRFALHPMCTYGLKDNYNYIGCAALLSLRFFRTGPLRSRGDAGARPQLHAWRLF